jgi:hypothetical protein
VLDEEDGDDDDDRADRGKNRLQLPSRDRGGGLI